MTKRFAFLFLFAIILARIPIYCHSGWGEHYGDMIAVLGFEDNPKLKEWAKFISSDMIDKPNPFYSNFKKRHPGFTCKHRLLFHWGYNTPNPWNSSLEGKVRSYCYYQRSQNKNKLVSTEDTITLFKREIRSEQNRRNKLINNMTENLFGFAHGGKDASYALFFASIAYNVHLIGDWTTDNSDLDGVQSLSEIIGLIVKDLQRLDKLKCKNVIKGITIVNRKYVGSQKKADALLLYLKQSVPLFVKEAQGGSIYRRLNKKGFKFRV